MIERVLCIDDDEITLMLSEVIIRKAGFAKQMLRATNGREGLAWFSDYFARKRRGDDPGEAPRIILLDLNMPIMDGWHFLDDYLMKYADRLPETKVVIVSSTVNPEDFSKANTYQIVIDFINKPLTAEGLIELMENEQLALCK